VAREEVELTVKRLSSARRLRLRVYDDGRIVVTAPKRLPQFLIDQFVNQHFDWIKAKHQKALTNQAELTDSRSQLFFHGQKLQFKLNVSSTLKSDVRRTKTELIATSPSEDHQIVRSVLEKWYRGQAKKHFQKRLPLLSDLVGQEVENITIRSQRTRWGSCSSRSTISLNWRLIMAPDFVSDYVIYHELAHLTHMNHSKRFWRLVENYCPRYKEAENWLKEHHDLLKF